jgi:hypothetical protein
MAEQKKERSNAEKIALATNTAGAIAGPAAIYQATQNFRRNEGGMPRQVALDLTNPKTKVGQRIGATRAGARARKIATGLKTPPNKYVKGAAIGLGGLSVGLQGANWAGDTIAAKLIADKNKEQAVTKRYDENGFTKFSGGDAVRGSGVGFNIAKMGNYTDYDAYNSDRVRRSARGEMLGAAGVAGLGAAGAGGVAHSMKGTGIKTGLANYRDKVIGTKAPKGQKGRVGGMTSRSKWGLGASVGALVATPFAAKGVKRFSDESRQDWT